LNSFNYILLLQAVLVFIVAAALCVIVWLACKSRVRVKVSGSVEVSLGDKS